VKQLFIVIISLAMLSTTASAVLEINNAQPKVHASEWKWVLDSTWQGLIRRNIKGCEGKPIYNGQQISSGLICRPKSETPYDAVSEGIGYGMLLALYADDQITFDLIYKAGKGFYLNFCQDWRQPASGGKNPFNDMGSATDADEDIAVSLIFAAKLVEKGKWGASDINYAADAQNAVDCMHGNFRDDGGLKPGNQWDPGYNIGYLAPAWYRIFKDFDSKNRNSDWDKFISKSYSIIEINPAYNIGMAADWSSHDGVPGGGSSNIYAGGRTFFKDAIRVLWRIATDYIWFKEPKAKAFLDNSLAFIKSKGGPSAANFYRLDDPNKGALLPADDKWKEFNGENNEDTWRWRSEHSHLTIGQWLTVAMAVGTDEDKIEWSDKMSEFYDWGKKVDFFGQATDRTGGIEDTLHNEMYFDQFLAWFGVSLMSGTWVNVMATPPASNTEGILGYPIEATPSSSSEDSPSSSSSLQSDLSSSSTNGPDKPSNSSSSGDSQTSIAIFSTKLKNLPGNAKIEVYNLRGEKQTLPIQTKGLYIVKIRYENSHTEILKVPIK
jgi:hypothetical protein